MSTPDFKPYRKGSELSREDQEYVKRSFIHRSTPDNPSRDRNLKIQFSSDADWLENSYFNTNAKGKLNPRFNRCWSNPTWPNNPELRK